MPLQICVMNDIARHSIGYLFASFTMIQGFSKEMACSTEDVSLNFMKVIDMLPSFLRKSRQHEAG